MDFVTKSEIQLYSLKTWFQTIQIFLFNLETRCVSGEPILLHKKFSNFTTKSNTNYVGSLLRNTIGTMNVNLFGIRCKRSCMFVQLPYLSFDLKTNVLNLILFPWLQFVPGVNTWLFNYSKIQDSKITLTKHFTSSFTM